MGRKAKFSKEVKVKACRDYKDGLGSFESIAKTIGANKSSIRQWYSNYEMHGESIFEYSNRNRSYTKVFKQSVVDEYLSGNYTYPTLSAKYIIDTKVLRNWVEKSYNGIELKDYDPKGDVYIMKTRKTTFEERLTIVKWTIENDMNYKLAADKFTIKYALVYQWVKKYYKYGEDGLSHKKRGPKAKGSIDENSMSEIEKLKLELEKEKALRKRAEFSLEVHKKKEEFARKIRTRK